jgi:hypothetical protein
LGTALPSQKMTQAQAPAESKVATATDYLKSQLEPGRYRIKGQCLPHSLSRPATWKIRAVPAIKHFVGQALDR